MPRGSRIAAAAVGLVIVGTAMGVLGVHAQTGAAKPDPSKSSYISTETTRKSANHVRRLQPQQGYASRTRQRYPQSHTTQRIEVYVHLQGIVGVFPQGRMKPVGVNREVPFAPTEEGLPVAQRCGSSGLCKSHGRGYLELARGLTKTAMD
jgi:hypothetical protein